MRKMQRRNEGKMKLIFIGAAHEVTGSCHYLNACGKNILIDCGMELNVSAGYQRMGVFYLFSMCVGKYGTKVWLGAAGVMMIAAGIYLRSKRK